MAQAWEQPRKRRRREPLADLKGFCDASQLESHKVCRRLQNKIALVNTSQSFFVLGPCKGG